MFDITLFTSFSAGLLSFLSPCVLPIVPFYMSYLTGYGINGSNEDLKISSSSSILPVLLACFFALGVTTVFVLLGASATYIGLAFRDYFDTLRWIAAIAIIVMGMHFLGLIKISLLYRQFKFERAHANPASILGAYVVGLTFAFGWTPCVGPILSAILFLAAGQETADQGVYLLLAYGLGMTVPFIICAIFINHFIRWLKKFRRYLGLIEKITGAVLVLFGILIATNKISTFAEWMLVVVPAFRLVG
jgi:cytochrome c-type biogenesis protein